MRALPASVRVCACVRVCVCVCVCVRVCALLYILDFFIGTQAHDTKLIVGGGGGYV